MRKLALVAHAHLRARRRRSRHGERVDRPVLYGLQDDAWLRYDYQGSLTERVLKLKQMGVGIVRFTLRWNEVAPTKPADARDPDDPAYDWAAYDEIFGTLQRLEDPGRRHALRLAEVGERRQGPELGADQRAVDRELRVRGAAPLPVRSPLDGLERAEQADLPAPDARPPSTRRGC